MASPGSPPREEEEEDDYLNFTFEDPAPKAKESSIARTARLKKESLARGQILSKSDKEKLASEQREKALATALPTTSSKGAAMMAKMGFTPGSALGAAGNQGRMNPIEVSLKEGKGGIGVDSEKKRKIREMAEEEIGKEKRVKLSAEEYREREGREREERRVEGMWWGSMKVLEGFEEDGGDQEASGDEGGKDGGEQKETSAKVNGNAKRRLKDVNLLYRPLPASRQKTETERLTRSKLLDSLSQPSSRTSNPEYISYIDDGDAEDKLALGDSVEDEDHDLEDEDLEEYEALPASERLEKVVKHLREKWQYCFWCKFRYPDAEMDGCPGEDEDSHG